MSVPRLKVTSIRAYLDWLNVLLEEPLRFQNGVAQPSARPGIGLAWNDDVVRKLCN